MSEGGERGDWAEQPRQISKRTRNARRTIINRNHLNMRKPPDYLMEGRLMLRQPDLSGCFSAQFRFLSAVRQVDVRYRDKTMKINKGEVSIHVTLNWKEV